MMPELQAYDSIRNKLDNGFLVFFNNIIGKQRLSSTFTGEMFSHCGIITFMYDSKNVKRIMLLESSLEGYKLINLRSYVGVELTILDIGLNWDFVESYALQKTEATIKNFSILKIKDILCKFWLKSLVRFLPKHKGEMSSEMVADIMQYSGYTEIENNLVSINQLYTVLKTSRLIIQKFRVLIN